MVQTFVVNRDVHQPDGRAFVNGADVLRCLSRVQVDEDDFGQLSFGFFCFVVVGFGEGFFFAEEGVNTCD
jgi:hypothetical protein